MKTCVSASEEPLIPLQIPFHPDLPQVLGYFRAANRVAFYWDVGGYEGLCYDGRVLSNDLNRETFGDFLRHPKVQQALKGYSLLACDETEPAPYWLLIDRRDAKLYLAIPNVARSWLHEQYSVTAFSAQPLVVGSIEELQALGKRIWQHAHEASRNTSFVERQAMQIVQEVTHLQFFHWLDAL